MAEDRDDSWQQEVADIKPLGKGQASAPLVDIPPHKPSQATVSTPAPPPVQAQVKHLKHLSVGNFSDIDAATIRKLKRGKLAINGKLDLHGMTKAQALDTLEGFIFGQVERGHKCALIITGKGSLSQPSILKTSLPVWLNLPNLRPYIIALDHAVPAHGGSGAFYVLLRKKAL